MSGVMLELDEIAVRDCYSLTHALDQLQAQVSVQCWSSSAALGYAYS